MLSPTLWSQSGSGNRFAGFDLSHSYRTTPDSKASLYVATFVRLSEGWSAILELKSSVLLVCVRQNITLSHAQK